MLSDVILTLLHILQQLAAPITSSSSSSSPSGMTGTLSSSSSSSEAHSEIITAITSFMLYCVRGWMTDLFAPHIQTIMDILIAFFRSDLRNALVLKTIASLTRFYANSHAQQFYVVIRNVANVAQTDLNYNSEEYVRELITLFSTLPTVCCAMLNADKECIQWIISITQHYMFTSSNRARTSCLSLLHKMLQLQTDNDVINAVFTEVAPQFVDVC